MNNYIKPDTVHILGSGKGPEYQTNFQTDYQEQPNPKQSRWTKIKSKVKKAWNKVMDIAKDIKDNIMPIVTGVGSFLSSWANFYNCTHKHDQQRGYYRWGA